MSRFKTAAIDTDNVGSWVERKRKGRMIRKQHTITGKWSRWMIDYKYTAERAVANTRQFIAETLERMTVAELRALANDRGFKIPSKARKADIIIALTETR